MANPLVQKYREALQAQGVIDPRSDDDITTALGQLAEESNRGLFDSHPEFAQDYRAIREANAPSLIGEAGRAFTAGTEGLYSTLDQAAALGARAVGLDGLSETFKAKAAERETAAAENAPTIATLEDIAPGEPNAVRRALSRDALRYGIAKAGSVAPSLAESVATGAVGAAIGSAAAPGVGTVAGGVTGALEKSLVKAALRSLLAKGEATTAANIAKEAAAIGAVRGGVAANALGSVVLNTGDVASEGADDATTVGLGLVSAIPDTILPAYVLKKLFPGVVEKEAVEAGKTFLARNAKKLTELAAIPPAEFGQEYFQEAINVVARNVKEGKDALTFDDADLRRLREAGIAGAAGGLLAAPGVMVAGRKPATVTSDVGRVMISGEAAPAVRLPTAGNPLPMAGESPVIPATPTNAPPARRVALMTEEQQVARLAELTAREAALTADEQTELSILQATVRESDQQSAISDQPEPALTPEPSAINATGLVPGAGEGSPAPVLPEIPMPVAPIAEEVQIQPQILAPVRVGDSAQVAEADAKLLSRDGRTGMVFPDKASALANVGPGQEVRPTGGGGYEIYDASPTEQLTISEPISPGPAIPESPGNPEAGARAPEETGGGEPPLALTPNPTLVSSPVEPAPSVPESPSLEQRLRDELAKPPPFSFGTIREGTGTLDLRDDPRFEALTPEMAKRLPVTGAVDDTGNRSKTRVAVVLEAPDGHYVKVGLLPHQEMAQIGGAGERDTGPAVQAMAGESRRAGTYQKLLKEGGNRPALLADIIAAGYKLRALVQFDTAPGNIFQRFDSRAAYDAAYSATEKSNGTAAAKTIPTASASEGAERRSIILRRDAIERQIDALGIERANADPARAAEIDDEINQHYAELAKIPEPRMMTEAPMSPQESAGVALAVDSDRTGQFTAATAAAKQAGLKVDMLAQGLLRANLADELSKRIDALAARYAAAPPAAQPAIQAQIERLQKNLDAVNQVRGVAFTPWHIALGLDDLQHQNITSLVALLHEVGHTIMGRSSPEMQARITRAVNGAMADLTAERAQSEKTTGVREANLGDPEELLVSTLAQRLATEGVPEGPSLARAIVQWVKDLYYRLAMGVQAAFGREPDPQMALDWFENQLRRTVGGDYDYRFAGIFDRLQPEAPSQAVVRHERNGGTPGSVSDFYDALTNTTQQSTVLPDTREGVEWDMRFMQVEPGPASREAAQGESDGLNIPAVEARARILGAAINEVSELVEKAYLDVAPMTADGQKMTFDEFWAIVGNGDTPKIRLAALEQVTGPDGQKASDAKIGGERMTDPMNQQARVLAKQMVYKAQRAVIRREATMLERGLKAETSLVDQAKTLNKIEGNLRNAEMHEATLRDALKEMIRGMVKGTRRGLDTAFAAGELAQAVREVEGLSERDAIPAEYQRVFKAVLADEVRVFDYLNAIAQLDMPLGSMTRAEIISGIEDAAVGDPVLARLIEPRNKPLLVALSALAKKNAEQMDLLQMRAIKDPEKYLALKAEFDEIRQATPARLQELSAAIAKDRKATTFADRIKQNAIKARAKLRRMQTTIQEVESTREIFAKMREAIDAKVDAMETAGAPAPSEWKPYEGATYLAMTQGEDGKWKAVDRKLGWNPDGTAKNSDQILGDLAGNAQYLRERKAKRGTKTYQMVERMTNELNMVAVLRKTPELKRVWFEKFLLPTAKLLVSGGGHGAAEAEKMLNKFQFVTFSKWHDELENPALDWSVQLTKAAKAAGMKDEKAFLDQIYEPALYLIESEPGREEGPVLREAVAAAKRRLPGEVRPEFDEAFKELLRRTKGMSERFLKVAQDNGLFVQDEKLGELRQAVARGWATVMRSMNASTVSTVLRDMGDAGWKMVFKDADTGATAVKGLDEGVGAGQRVVGAASFDALLPENAVDEADAEARTAVLENPQAFAQATRGFFTPGIVQRWLEPFINKPGEPVFYHGDEAIDPLEVQRAWEESGGNVARWIDRLGERLRVSEDLSPASLEASQGETPPLSPEAQFRVSMLKRLDALFAMESRIAAEANQTKGLFDATGRPPHLIMDSRENELLPPEHVTHAAFDRDSSRNLLATLAFHAAFGRNGEAMNRAMAEIQGNLRARKQAFDSVVAGANGRDARELRAKQLGYDFKELKRAADIYQTVEQGIAALKAQFGFNSSATMLNGVRGGMELLHFVANQTTNNPKTGLLNLLQVAQRAIARKSIGAATVRDTANASGELTKQFFGTVMQNFGLGLMKASRYAADIGGAQGQAIGNLPWETVAGMTAGRRGEQVPLAIKAMRAIGAVQRKGVRVGFGESKEFPRLNMFPVVGNPMQAIGMAAAISNGTAEARAIAGVVKAAMDFFAANPEKLNDPTYRLTHADIAAHNRALAMDKTGFEYFTRKMVEYNIGPLEGVARAAMDRATRGEPILTKDQVLKAAQLAGNEVDLQSSINTNPASWDTNSILKVMTPLLGWPIRQMNSVHEAMRTADGRFSALQAMKTLGILAGWSLPVGLAFTFLTDEYDDKILRKKTNLGRVDPLALIPGGGAVAALATSDIPAKEQLLAMFSRLSRAGNIYGLGFDFASSALAGTDPTSGQRPFSMDSRILAFSQLMNIKDALTNWYNSGFVTTYANVERPLIQAMAGSGALQAMDAIGAALGIDNQELRIAQRTNVAQWLRAAGREAGLELRRGGGGNVAPTPTSVWTREMYLAALANDRLSFADAYRRAVDAERESGEANPEAKVLESWRARDPREVFGTKPDEAQMRRMLGTMSENGREAVQGALRLYQQYSQLIAVTPAERYEHRLLSQMQRQAAPDINALRARMAQGALSGVR